VLRLSWLFGTVEWLAEDACSIRGPEFFQQTGASVSRSLRLVSVVACRYLDGRPVLVTGLRAELERVVARQTPGVSKELRGPL
jgi:hypothetical protein